jgi:integral membrane sensor domain MASE1
MNPTADTRTWFNPRYLGTVAAVALVYFGAAKFGLSLAFSTKQVTALWPPTGIAVAALLLGGYRVWPAIYLAVRLSHGSRWVDWAILTPHSLEFGMSSD